uniref:Secreted protein n=1 Tax=Panagrellus redivivus TaxID=6233 RepID=A0A7E4UVV8_PANRE
MVKFLPTACIFILVCIFAAECRSWVGDYYVGTYSAAPVKPVKPVNTSKKSKAIKKHGHHGKQRRPRPRRALFFLCNFMPQIPSCIATERRRIENVDRSDKLYYELS